MKLTGYNKCQHCGEIFKDANHNTAKLNNPSPCCGATNESRHHWPTLDVLILIGLVEKQNLDDFKERKVAIVFVATLLEMLLEETVTKLAYKHCNSDTAVEALLDSYQGRQKRIALFNKLSGLKMKELLNNNGFTDYLFWWEAISTLRNKIVHQGFYAQTEIDVNMTIRNLLNNSIDVFALLNNESNLLQAN
ncbi:hypothetical protein NSU18_19995 [Paenibacillus sp. FSL H8-0048]|uniref:hypothetical protein n=1 Tax=Paenibacillus sp. FSL H8-0048 TaxID=2954508 RepID=UPI0030F9D621